MADNNNTGRAAMAAAAMGQRSTESIIEGLERRYNTQRNIHTVGGTNDDRLAKKEAYIQEQRHQKELEFNKQMLELTEKKLKAEKDGQKELMESYQSQIKNLRVQGPGEVGFDTDAISQNFSSTLEEIALNFSEQTRAEQKAELKRLEELKKLIADSNASEKGFLVSQLDNINNLAQSEYNKRATMAARATEKAAELAEQYMDVSSLYAGFVDHNPVMMALWRIGGDFIKRWRVQKKAQREAIARDQVNAQQAEELNERNQRMAEDEGRRADEINAAREDILAREREAVAARKSAAEAEKAAARQSPADTTSPTFTRDPDVPTNFNPLGGDEALDRDFFTDLFGGVDEDGDETGFTMEGGSSEPTIQIDDSEPVVVQPESSEDSAPLVVRQEPSEEAKAEAKFIRDTEARKDQLAQENHAEAVEHQNKMFEKLIDIEDAILTGNKLTEDNGKALGKLDSGGGLLERLGLGKIAGMFKGPILKALMMFGPIVGGLSALLGKIGLGGLGERLSGGYGRAVDRMGGGPDAQARGRPGRNGSSRGGRFSRMARGAGRGIGTFARGGGMLLRGGAALLGSTAGALAASGAAGYGVGTLINDHVLSDDQKESIGNFVGKGVDNVLSFFGNDDAQRRLDINAQMEQMNNQSALGLPKPKAAPKANIGTEPKESVFEKTASGANLVVQTDKIESTNMVNNHNRQAIEVPASKQAEDRLHMLESKVVELEEVKRSGGDKPVLPVIPKKTTQKVVKSGDTSTQVQRGGSARNSDSSIQRLTDRFVSYGVS